MDELAVTRTIHIQAERARVWAALTEPPLIEQWLGERAELDLAPGGAGALTWDEHGRFELVVVHVEAPRVFAFRWCPEPDTVPGPGTSTLVSFTLDDDNGGTQLTVAETGWDALDPRFDARALRDGNVEGWAAELDNLRAVLEKQDSQ